MPLMRPWARWLAPLAALVLCAAGCSDSEEERVGSASSLLDAPLAEAYCTAQVDGVGTIETETDYLPHVVTCEHGGANIEALKAQAIAARSVLYYALGTHGSICDGTNCQVYTCGRPPEAIHQQAVDETSGVYLAYNNNVTYAAFRAGDPNTSPPDCVGGPGETSCITYNEGLSGTDVEQTSSLWVHDPSDAGYGTNRGCMSQNGGSCLEDSLGYDYLEILQFYYGLDIELLQAPGDCILPLPGEGGAGGGAAAGGGVVGGAPAGGFGGTAGAAASGIGGRPPGLIGTDENEGSCGCRVVASGSRSLGPAALLAALLLGVRLRRRRRPERPACVDA